MSRESDPRFQVLRELTARIGHEFKDPELLERALVHSSMGNEGKASYERLEFLGDAILGFVVADHLYRLQPEIAEGDLTDRRARIVSREPLAAAGEELDLVRYVQAGRGLREDELRSPRIQADLVEALLGAVYLDGGIRAARRFVRRFLLARAGAACSGSEPPRDPKSRFLHYAQANSLGQPAYPVVSVEGPDHARIFTVTARLADEDLAVGTASNKRGAEMAAAEAALEVLRARRGEAEGSEFEPPDDA